MPPPWRTIPRGGLVLAGPDGFHWQQKLAARARTVGIADSIVWTGMLRDSMKWSALAAAEVFVLPSHQENFGIAVAESLACGVPVLISARSTSGARSKHRTAGFTAPDTLQGTTSLLTRWQQLPEAERSTMRRNARQCFQQHFDIEHSAARTAEGDRIDS